MLIIPGFFNDWGGKIAAEITVKKPSFYSEVKTTTETNYGLTFTTTSTNYYLSPLTPAQQADVNSGRVYYDDATGINLWQLAINALGGVIPTANTTVKIIIDADVKICNSVDPRILGEMSAFNDPRYMKGVNLYCISNTTSTTADGSSSSTLYGDFNIFAYTKTPYPSIFEAPAIYNDITIPVGSCNYIIENHGKIYSMGGKGGAAGRFPVGVGLDTYFEATPYEMLTNVIPAEDGGDGITVIDVPTNKVVVNNYGLIAAGGGGGGGGGHYAIKKPGIVYDSSLNYRIKRITDVFEYIGGNGTGGAGAPFSRILGQWYSVPFCAQGDFPPGEFPIKPWSDFLDANKDVLLLSSLPMFLYRSGSFNTTHAFEDGTYDFYNVGNASLKQGINKLGDYRVKKLAHSMFWRSRYHAVYDPNTNLTDDDINNVNLSVKGTSFSTFGGSDVMFYRIEMDTYQSKWYDTAPILRNIRGGNGGILSGNGEDAQMSILNSQHKIVTDPTKYIIITPPGKGGKPGLVSKGNVSVFNIDNGITMGR